MRYAAFRRIPSSKPSIFVPHETRERGAAVGGMSSNRSIAAAAPGYAQLIENGYSTQTGIKPRAGRKRFATMGTRAVQSLMAYQSGTVKKLLAASNGAISDISAPVNPLIPGATLITGLTNNDFSYVNFATPGGEFLIAVNGTNLHLVYNGSTIVQNTPAITGTTSDNFSYVWTFANRLWFVKKNSKSAYYLPVDSIGGAATEFPLAGVVNEGGALLYGATWSSDSGSGLGQRCVFVFDTGEAVVYEGTDPSSATTFRKIGVYKVSKPLGKHSSINIGGDLLMVNAEGIVPLSQANVKDTAALSLASITKNIAPEWKQVAQEMGGRPFRFTKWAEKNIGYVSFAGTYTLVSGTDTIDVPPYNYVVNLETGAWSKYTGWDIQCSAYHNNKVYFGSANGAIYEAESGGNDDGAYYVFRYLDWPDGLGAPSATKTFVQVRTTFTYKTEFNAWVGASVDYKVKWPTPPSAFNYSTSSGKWDTGNKWDTGGKWDIRGETRTLKRWRSIGRTGYRMATMIQISFNSTDSPDIEFVSGEITVSRGGVVV